MGLSSEIHTIERISAHDERTSVCTGLRRFPLTDPDPGVSNHPVRDKSTIVTVPSPTTGTPRELDFEALRHVISHFRNARMQASSHAGESSPGSFSISPHQSFPGQRAGPPSDDSLSDLSASSFQASASQVSSQMETVSQREQMHAETVSTSDHVVVSQAEDQVGSETQNNTGERASVVVEATSNTCSDIDPTWNRSGGIDVVAEPPVNPNTSGAASDKDQEEQAASEQGTTKNPIPKTSSSHAKPAEITGASRNYRSRGGKRPVPGRSPYGMNPLVTMDRVLQSGSLWPAAQASQNNAMGLGSRLLNSSVANSFTQSGLRNLLPSSNMAWNNFAQGSATNMWGIQPGVGLGQVHRTPFIQSYTWHGNPAFQGNGYPPHRGGYGGW